MPKKWKRSALWAAVLVCALATGLTAGSAASAAPTSVPNTGFVYAGAWGSQAGAHYSNQVGATATLTFTVGSGGGTISLRSVKSPDSGYAGVSIDGGRETLVNQYDRNLVNNLTVYKSQAMTAGQHTMKVRVTGKKSYRSNNTFVSVTGADVSNGSMGAPAPSTPAPSTPAPSTPAPSTPAPSTPAPSTTAPSTTAPSTTAPSTTAPSTTAPATAPSGVTLDLDADTCDTSQWTTNGMGGVEAGDPAHQVTFGTSARRDPSGCSTRFEMHNAQSDLWAGHSYRSMLAKYDSNEGTTGGKDFTYGFSFQMQGAIPRYQHLWELHQRANIYSVDGDLAVAPHAVMIVDGRLEYRMMTGAGMWSGSEWTRYTSYNDRVLLRPTLTPGTWYDVMVRVRASEGGDGLVEVFARAAGEQWPTTPTWSKAGPTLPYIPGGLDPNVPTKRSTLDTAGGQSGLYLEVGMYAGSPTWHESAQQLVLIQDNLRRYRDVASAKTGFPQ
jgi:hypothetical protein